MNPWRDAEAVWAYAGRTEKDAKRRPTDIHRIELMMKYILSEEKNRIAFTAYAPLHTFKGWVTESINGEADIDLENKQIENVTVRATTGLFDTGDAFKNEEMHQFIGVKKNPQATFTFNECTYFVQADEHTYHISVNGILDFMDIRRSFPLDIVAIRNGKGFSAGLVFKWSFKGHGIKPPQLFFLKLKDKVDIRVHLDFKEAG
jgi:hypothetical protein